MLLSAKSQTARRATRRVFFAIPLHEAQRASFVHATRKAVRASGGRPVLPLDLHVTLAFIGAVGEEDLPLLRSVGSAVAQSQGIGAFDLAFDRLEHWARPQVLCLTSTQISVQAEALAHAVQRALREHEVAFEQRSWRAHATIARHVLSPHMVGAVPPLPWSAVEFGLFESRDAPAVPRYQALDLWPLAAPPEAG